MQAQNVNIHPEMGLISCYVINMTRKPDLTRVGEHLTRRMRELDMTQEGLAKATGLGQSTISRVINGGKTTHLLTIAEAVKLTADQLASGVWGATPGRAQIGNIHNVDPVAFGNIAEIRQHDDIESLLTELLDAYALSGKIEAHDVLKIPKNPALEIGALARHLSESEQLKLLAVLRTVARAKQEQGQNLEQDRKAK